MDNKDFLSWKREELLKLPVRGWADVKDYDSIIVCPTRMKHDSGYRLMAIIGCFNMHPTEVAAYCDDLNFKNNGFWIKYAGEFQCDMILSNCIHFHSWFVKFRVGHSLSSTDVELIPRKDIK